MLVNIRSIGHFYCPKRDKVLNIRRATKAGTNQDKLLIFTRGGRKHIDWGDLKHMIPQKEKPQH